ncbi:dTDP-4-dehydrorhamnose reductase [Roseovarius gaetbuli]|uniref:dTDP-4-dehydrorhamnose reductase n=1 Tax=Roseovarius gaetbuli TaxID=1356575 RepID=A0A1X7A432_9RHOB|nr:dTDP-4-dehydrorhamnose reductase [Roseovarius gaetbuli]SLN70024.1 dTDP-4-dehydrorhamnose reductase [Roseovarius gaetbuli]
MSLLIFGKTGQVAQALQATTPVTALDRSAADLADPAACARAIHAHAPRAVINAAGWTAVDDAEDHPEAAHVINALAPAAMAAACAERNIPFVHISTDYVFDGQGNTPYAPDDPAAPLGVYGITKEAGERAVRAAGGCSAILRTSWVFSAHGNNFVKTMLRLGTQRDALSIVNDQIGGPTPARAIAAACLEMATQLHTNPDRAGTYHLSGDPDVSWAAFATEIFAQAGLACTVTPIPSAEFPTKARRPANSRLSCDSLAATFGITRPDWRLDLADVLYDLKGSPL